MQIIPDEYGTRQFRVGNRTAVLKISLINKHRRWPANILQGKYIKTGILRLFYSFVEQEMENIVFPADIASALAGTI